MILADSVILHEMEQGNIIIDGFDPKLMNPNSVDLTLGAELKMYPTQWQHVDTLEDIPDWARDGEVRYDKDGYSYPVPLDVKNKVEPITVIMGEEGFVLKPGEVYLYACNERIGVKGNICAQVQAKSSLGRLGLDIVVGPAGFIDSGFVGSLVLELRTTRLLRVYPDMKICQIKFERVEGTVAESYDQKSGSKYMNQTGVQESLMHKNFENESDNRTN